ncbi:MAG: VOC family protein [Actinomycetota bacterium]|nr:VOC family protein [Actinomycetota bacterium]
MSTRLVSLVFDVVDPAAAAQFWYILLGGTATQERGGAYRLVAPDVGGCGIDLVFVPADGRAAGKNRVHVDLGSESTHEYQILTSLAVQVGARVVNVGQGPGVPWTVFEDPEANEFCILEPGDLYHHTGPLAAIVVDSADPPAMAEFWSTVTGWPIRHRDENSAALRSTEASGPWIEFLRVPDPRRGARRVRFAIAAVDEEADAAVARLLDMGAERVAGGVELVDPEGNEFRMVSSSVHT